jgi:1,4-alpha-glucan branching enzyme
VGEFNSWDPKPEHWAMKNSFGVWELFLPDGPSGASAIPHRS